MSLCWIQHLEKLIPLRNTSQLFLSRFASSVVGRSRKHQEQPFFDTERVHDPSIITVPVRLEKRLEKKVKKENTKYFHRQRIIQESRKGSKTQVVLSARRPGLNHYKGQSYDPKGSLPLISDGWKHRKSYGDFFTIHPSQDNAFVELDGRETFESLGLSTKIDTLMKTENLNTPTLIQATAVPEILKGKNNLLAAETGCGKTFAYLLPVFEQVLERKGARMKRSPNQPLALILLPTRELAEQVATVSSTFGYKLGIRTKLLQGGCVTSQMNNPSTKEVDILVATIHIVSTLSTMDVYDMTKVKHIVLDEADTLLDDSFSEEVIRFLSRFRFDGSSKDSVVQATLVSATMPRSIESILGEVIPFETLNRITTPGLLRVAKSVPQKFLRVRKMEKRKVILDLVNQTLLSKSPMMIFSNKSQTCHWLSTYLASKGIDCIAVHGKIKPGERRGLLRMYLNGEVDIMVCTDLGSRGIDTIRTKHDVNYEFPRFLADYVHRCGRVGRVGSANGGLITNLISSANEVELVQQIETSVRKDESMQKVNANIKWLLNARYGMYQTIQPIGTKEDE